MRTQGHVQDVKNLFINGKSSNSFALHFASLVLEGTAKKNVKDFIKVKVDILWQGDPLSCVKTEVASYAQRNDMLSSSSPTRLPTWLSTSEMRCMVPAAIDCDFTGSTTQRMPTPALMSPEG
jgi:hypothetical protein